MLFMDLIAEIRRRHLVSKESISAIARDLNLSRPTVRKHCRTQRKPLYRRQKQPTPMLGGLQETLETWLRVESQLPKAQRRSARRLFEGLQAEGYHGAYDSVQRFVRCWKAIKAGPAVTQAYVPLSFSPGEVCQFDWSHEHVELGGVMHIIKVAHFRLTFSRQMFVVAYPRETQEMVFDAHIPDTLHQTQADPDGLRHGPAGPMRDLPRRLGAGQRQDLWHGRRCQLRRPRRTCFVAQ